VVPVNVIVLGVYRHFAGPIAWQDLYQCVVVSLFWFVIKFARAGGGQYLNSSVVFFAEILKMLLSVLLMARAEGSLAVAVGMLRQQFMVNPLGTLHYAVPALAYTIMNNLVFLSLDKLNAAVQQVTYQLKILTAAVLAVVMLGKRIQVRQWLSLALLILGVALVQWPKGPNGDAMRLELPIDPATGALMLDPDAVVGLVGGSIDATVRSASSRDSSSAEPVLSSTTAEDAERIQLGTAFSG